MPKIVLSLLLLFFSFPQAGCLSQNAELATDNSSDPYSYDFGEVKRGEALKHDFVLTNTSDKELNIKDVNTSCGCTVGKIGKKKLPPGESTGLEVSVDTKDYRGPTQQFVYVHTDSLDNPIIRFIIKADVSEK